MNIKTYHDVMDFCQWWLLHNDHSGDVFERGIAYAADAESVTKWRRPPPRGLSLGAAFEHWAPHSPQAAIDLFSGADTHKLRSILAGYYLPDNLRKTVQEALVGARPWLWNGVEPLQMPLRAPLCFAIRADRSPGSPLARVIVAERIAPYATVAQWLDAQGRSELTETPEARQAYRKAWLEKLIEEFSDDSN